MIHYILYLINAIKCSNVVQNMNDRKTPLVIHYSYTAVHTIINILRQQSSRAAEHSTLQCPINEYIALLYYSGNLLGKKDFIYYYIIIHYYYIIMGSIGVPKLYLPRHHIPYYYTIIIIIDQKNNYRVL